MVTHWVLEVVAFIIGGLLSLVPALPSFVQLDAAAGWVEQMGGWMVPLSFWLPFPVALACAAIVLPFALTGAAIKGLRLVVSNFTGGGGSAG